jgi:hypothetical protein
MAHALRPAPALAPTGFVLQYRHPARIFRLSAYRKTVFRALNALTWFKVKQIAATPPAFRSPHVDPPKAVIH